MGDELGCLYHELCSKRARLYRKWDDHVSLFGTRPSRIDLLHNAAPVCFRIFQDALWEYIFLNIAQIRAIAAGAKINRPVKDQFYGDRTGSIEDPFGHIWHVATHTRDLSMAEIKRGAEQAAKEEGG